MELEIKDLQDMPLPMALIRSVVSETAETASLTIDRLSCVFVDDERIQEINARFRQIDRPTDVISFEADPGGDEATGEVIISAETAARQATAAGHSFDAELAWLLAHGVLHVAGMDDTTEDGLEAMIETQHRVIARLDLEVKV